MSDQGFREIQLGGKQVVFLFLLLAVALVGTFLLGVSAGRGANPADAATQATPTPIDQGTDAAAATPMPPATTPGPGDFKYPQVLKDTAGKSATPAVTPTPSAAPPTPAATATPTPTGTAAPRFPGSPPPPGNSSKPGATIYLQVNAFSTNAAAAKEVSHLKSLGIPAFTVDAPGGGAHYKVRVGPYDKAGAAAMTARLRKQGYKPSPIR
jgi:hypothetical protein